MENGLQNFPRHSQAEFPLNLHNNTDICATFLEDDKIYGMMLEVKIVEASYKFFVSNTIMLATT